MFLRPEGNLRGGWQLDELSIGWGLINIEVAIAGWEEFEFTAGWPHVDGCLESFAGREPRDVAPLEWRPSGPDLASGTVPVEFVLDTDRLRAVNGLDENRIEVGVAQPACIRHRLGRWAVRLGRLPVDLNIRQQRHLGCHVDLTRGRPSSRRYIPAIEDTLAHPRRFGANSAR